MKNHNLKPFVKWVGGKSQLLKEIKKHLPESFETYFEPFVGAGAVLFNLQPKNAVVNDLNKELITAYKVVKNNFSNLIDNLRFYENTSEHFYKVRRVDRNEFLFSMLTNVQKTSRFIYLNKTCFNGLYRVNSKGQFNSPFGKYDNPNICDKITLHAVNEYLNNNEIKFLNTDFEEALKTASKDDFVYLDPPYNPVSKTANFTSYTKNGFDESDQIRLKNVCNELNERGVKFLLSSSNTVFVKVLYKDYEIIEVLAKRSVNSDGKKRGKVKELLIKNY